MSTPAPNTDPNALLMEQVAVPAFFEKVARDAGYSPASNSEAQEILNLGNMVYPAVQLFFKKQAEAGRTQVQTVVKAAADAAYDVIGIDRNPPTPSSEFALDATIRAAAAQLFDLQVKAAAEAKMATEKAAADAMTPVVKPTEDEEEEEAKKKIGVPTAA